MEEVIAAKIIIEDRSGGATAKNANNDEQSGLGEVFKDIQRMMHKQSIFGSGGGGGGAGGLGSLFGGGGEAGGAAAGGGLLEAAGAVTAILGVLGLDAYFHALQNTNPDTLKDPNKGSVGGDVAHAGFNYATGGMGDGLLTGMDLGQKIWNWLFPSGNPFSGGGAAGGSGGRSTQSDWWTKPSQAGTNADDHQKKVDDIMQGGIENQDELNQLLNERQTIETQITALNQNNENLTKSELDARSRMLDTLIELNAQIMAYNKAHQQTIATINQENSALSAQAAILQQLARSQSQYRGNSSSGTKTGSGPSITATVGGNEYTGHIVTDIAINGGKPTYIGIRPVA